MTSRIAILGPFETASLLPFLDRNRVPANLPRGMGGSCLVNLVLARLHRGWPTDVITLDPEADKPIQRIDGDLVRLWIIRRRTRRALRDGYATEVAGLVAALRESQPAVCHANWTYEYGRAALAQATAPAVITVHDHAARMLRHLGWRYAPHYLMSRSVIARAPRCTAVSPHIAAYVNRLRLDTSPVIPNLVPEPPALPPFTPDPERPQVISLLTWARFRNATTALRAFARFRRRHPQAVYILAGPGFESGGPAEHWAVSHRLADGVLFLGRIPYPAALEAITRATVLLHPSLEESFGAPVAEAMALRIPVVAAREAGGPAWLCENNHGHLVPGRSVGAMDDALERAWASWNDPAGSATRAAAHAHILARCGAEPVLTAWNNLYRSMLDAA